MQYVQITLTAQDL